MRSCVGLDAPLRRGSVSMRELDSPFGIQTSARHWHCYTLALGKIMAPRVQVQWKELKEESPSGKDVENNDNYQQRLPCVGCSHIGQWDRSSINPHHYHFTIHMILMPPTNINKERRYLSLLLFAFSRQFAAMRCIMLLFGAWLRSSIALCIATPKGIKR